jgi:DNA replication and repair protein RecF
VIRGVGVTAVHLTAIQIQNYRNLERVELAPAPHGLVLIGDNGHGKTNFLEAVYYLQVLRAVRGTRDTDVVRFGADAFHIGGTVEGCPGTRSIGIGFDRATKQKRARLDGVVVDRLSDAVGAVPSVMFSPADVALVAGEPAERRRFLDIALGLTSRAYLSALQRYRAAILRRNTILRDGAQTGRPDAHQAAAWEPALAEHGATLVDERRRWVQSAAPRFAELCAAIGEADVAELAYSTSIGETTDHGGTTDALLVALDAKRPLDLRRGTTHVGPHRDNLVLSLGARDTRTFGSAGQHRTAAIALRILEAETYRERTGATPIFLLDDPFAELDVGRASRILALLSDAMAGQTLLAVPRTSDIPEGFGSLTHISVRSGRLSRA